MRQWKKEIRRLFGKVLGKPVCLDSVPENSQVVIAKLLISVKNWEGPANEQTIKGRLVGTGNRIFDKWMRILRNLPTVDMWQPLCSMTGARFVHARATAHQRESESIDLIQAYGQVPLCGDIPFYLVIPEWIVMLLPAEMKKRFS